MKESGSEHDPPHQGGSTAARAYLTLGHVLAAIGAEHGPPIGLDDIRVIRHSFNTGEELGLRGPEDLTEDKVRSYTRFQGISPRQFPAEPERYWVVLVADGKRRSRLWGAFENHGEIVAERTAESRFFDLRRSDILKPLVNRLVVEWDTPRVWHRRASSAADMPVLEIADRDKVPFPGFDDVLLTFHELGEMVSDRRYTDWQVALSQVQGIYLITDASNGKQYVGKASGAEQILQRWRSYAQDGHGGNRALRELAKISTEAGGAKTDHARHFVFSILRVFGPSTSSSVVDKAELHYKMALLTREHGLNRN
ncbi:GIY-YIG nuclease family protein [Mycolicibacterium sp. 050232]|uniref:GIY-YIG nuclease family protein n=1 Tax=Mycolicibacterium sp. 050232 TaxID=3113982 RepID=UPI002E2B1963|nr:GIY-YIG nuclease family protein [Mycolicibacterium sp. 050232]MED5811525.1 GIY-YIG nuclease family protein [Mycolicibacterium sp. 050232]